MGRRDHKCDRAERPAVDKSEVLIQERSSHSNNVFNKEPTNQTWRGAIFFFHSLVSGLLRVSCQMAEDSICNWCGKGLDLEVRAALSH